METARISVLLPRELKDSLTEASKKEDRSISAIVRIAIQKYLEEKEN